MRQSHRLAGTAKQVPLRAFILAAAPLNHVIVVSLEMFAALQAGAHFGYLDWLRWFVCFANAAEAPTGLVSLNSMRDSPADDGRHRYALELLSIERGISRFAR